MSDKLHFFLEIALELFCEAVLVQKIVRGESNPQDMIPIKGSDAATSRANLTLLFAFSRSVKDQVLRKRETGVLGKQEMIVSEPLLSENCELARDDSRSKCDPASDDVRLSGAVVENPRRNEMKNIFLPSETDGMPSVGTAGASRNDIRPFGEKVDEFAFPCVAPLIADDTKCAHPIKKVRLIVSFHFQVSLLVRILPLLLHREDAIPQCLRLKDDRNRPSRAVH